MTNVRKVPCDGGGCGHPCDRCGAEYGEACMVPDCDGKRRCVCAGTEKPKSESARLLQVQQAQGMLKLAEEWERNRVTVLVAATNLAAHAAKAVERATKLKTRWDRKLAKLVAP